MKNLSNIGRTFYGIAIAVLGFLTVYYTKFPYMLIPPTHFSPTVLTILTYIFGTLLILVGACIIFGIKAKLVSLLLGAVLLLIFCFYFIPYQFIANPNFMQFGEWENAEKELALSGGAFVIASCFSPKNENSFIRFLSKLLPFGGILFSLTIICFGIDHFLDPQGVADYTPAWVPLKVFWAYFCGMALIGSAIAIILKIRVRLFAILLGTMIFIWFCILHIPRVITSPSLYLKSELTSAVLALAYSGIAYVIAGMTIFRQKKT